MISLENFNQNFDKIERWLLYLMIATFPITTLPKRYPLPASMHNLPFAFLTVAILAAVVYFASHRKLYPEMQKKAKIYLTICVVWPLLCTVIGAVTFPYWDNTATAFVRETSLIQKIAGVYPAVLDNTTFLRLKYSNSLLLSTIQGLLVPLLGIYFVVYVTFYHKTKEYLLDVISRGAVIGACAMAVYSIIEIPWILTGNSFCADLLKVINVHLYDVETTHEWWPPILWKGQLRSLSQEPSFFGIISPFILPLLWYRAFGLKEKMTVVILILFTYMTYMTRARTAQVILLGELVILVILTLWGRYPEWGKKLTKILASTFCAFCLFFAVPIIVASFHEISSVENSSVNEDVYNYFQEDLFSAGTVSQRSNLARIGNTVALINTGIQNPVFGIGTGLESVFIAENMPDFAQESGEVQHWISMLREEGFLQSGIPVFNTLAAVFACYGLMGLFLFVVPLFWVAVNALRWRKTIFHDYGAVCILVIFVGQCATLLSNWFLLTYPLALAMAIYLVQKCNMDLRMKYKK